MNEGKLRIKDYINAHTTYHEQLRVKSYHDIKDKRYDMIFMAVKNAFTEDAMSSSYPLLKKDGVVMSLQNGMGHYEVCVISYHIMMAQHPDTMSYHIISFSVMSVSISCIVPTLVTYYVTLSVCMTRRIAGVLHGLFSYFMI